MWTPDWCETCASAEGVLEDELYLKVDTKYQEHLRGWNAAVADKAATVARMVMIGDSLTELYNATYATRINTNFNAYPTSNFSAAGSGVGAGPWDTWTGTKDLDHGLGSRGGTLDVGEEGTLIRTCDGFILSYDVQKTGGSDLEIYIDGVLITTISTTDAGITPAVESGRLWTSSALIFQAHTLRVVAVGSGTAMVGGALFTAGNRTTGVQVWSAGHAGWDCADFLADESTFEAINTLDPALVTIFLGTNDYGDLSAFSANLLAIVQRVKTDTPLVDVAILAPYQAFDRANWQDYVDACRAVALAEECAFVDLYESMGGVGAVADVYNLSSDNVHLNTKGASFLANTFADVLYVPGVHATSPALRADGSVTMSGNLTAEVPAGKAVFGSIFGYPIAALYDSLTDTYPDVAIATQAILNALGTSATGGGFAFGAGGATNLTEFIFFESAGVIKTGSKLIVADATAATHALNRQTADARYQEITAIGTTASSATPTINTDTYTGYSITALAANITSFTTNLSGTPVIGQKLIIDITDNGTSRTIAWGASFEASGTIALPTATTISTRMDIAFRWNPATSKWRIVGIS